MIAVSAAAGRPVTVQQGGTASRIPALDFIKGTLVLFMVLYHWLNYFYSPQGEIYKYLRFLTPSFIFITGFLISHVLFNKYGTGDSKLSKRLFLRGLKLLGIFVLLNLLISLLFPDSTMLFEGPSLANLEATFLTGNVFVDGLGKTAAFTILVPIGYLLMISALLSLEQKLYKHTFHVVCGLFLLCSLFLDLYGVHNTNLELVAIGLLGVALGYTSEAKMTKLVSHPYMIALAYCAYLGAITIWDVSFPLRVTGVCLTVLLIYIVGARSGEPGSLRRHVLVLGKYSLFGYISQIAILQMLQRGLNHINHGAGVLVLSFVAGFALTMTSVEIVDRTRPKLAALDWVYRAIFA